MPEKKSIIGKEIFAVGKWNGDQYTKEDLEEMVRAFSETANIYRPYIKLGHNEGQEMLQADGLPAAGWIENLRIMGNKLVCDFVDLPEKIYKLIVENAYRYVSSEILWNIDILGKKYDKMLSGCALLGTEMPAVMGLNEFANLYKLDAKFIKKYTIEKMGDNFMPEINETVIETNEKANEELVAAKASLAKMQEENAALVAKNKEAEDKLTAISADAVKFKMDAEKAELETFLTAEKIAPGAREYVRELLGTEKKEYSIKEKTYSKKELLKEILRVYSEGSVNLVENSQAGNKASIDEENVRIDEIKKYASEKKISFADAYREIGSADKGAEDNSDDETEE